MLMPVVITSSPPARYGVGSASSIACAQAISRSAAPAPATKDKPRLLTLARLRAVIAMALCCQLRDAPPAGFFGGGDECTEQAQPIGRSRRRPRDATGRRDTSGRDPISRSAESNAPASGVN